MTTANTVHVRASRAALRQAVAGIPSESRSGGPIADAMMTRCGMVLLGRIKQAFVVKARGGTDEAGDKWQPLSPRTVAYSKTRMRGRTRTEKKRNVYPSQALNQKQQDRWWEIYRRQLARFKGDKRHAAAFAWAVLKSEGAQTLVDKYGHREVEILRDTGLLLNSLSPGTTVSEQVFRIGRGEVIVGTNRKGAKQHHEGIPGRLPQRRLWPEPGRWPTSWWSEITETIKQGILELAVHTLKETA